MSGFRRKTYPLIEAADDALWRAFQGHALTQAVVPKTDSSAGLQSRIRDHALRIGFDAIGFCRADLAPEARERLMSFLKAGCHGDMGWLADRTEQRSQPKSLWPDVRSVIVVGMSYAPAHDPLADAAQRSCGNISVYARNRDYHDIIKGRLKHLAQFVVSRFACQVKVFVDTAPVMEKPLAQQSGLGWQGKHTNLVSRQHGSWLLLGEIYTDLELNGDGSSAGRCGSCSRCLDICPTKAFPSPYRMDATRCISYLTIEHHGPIPVELRPLMGNHIYGCDDCLAICPWNKFAKPTSHEKLVARADLAAPALSELAQLDDKTFRTRFAGSPIKRIGRDRFVRNVLIAIGNSGDRALLPVAEQLERDQDPVVAEAAYWAAGRLKAGAIS
jgi:epoxyqueuosine reductase